MAANLTRFVDSIASAPTVRLDLNDEVSWFVKSFSAPPPRLRRSMSSNSMRDGVHVGSSTYDARTLTIELENIKSTQDTGATEIQKLWRELDRPDNYLMYQPTGATKPVFFRLYRSDASQLEDVIAQAAMRTITIELLAEPFALGLKESIAAATVTNNPLAGTNPCYFDVTGVLGDVAAPMVWWDSSANSEEMRTIAVQHKAAGGLENVFTQAESVTLGTDTTNPGGGPDAAMSGTGTNNYVRTSFSTAIMTTRLTWAPGDISGRWRVLAFVRRNATTSTLTVRALRHVYNPTTTTVWTGDTVTVPATASTRLVLDLGIVSLSARADKVVGHSTSTNTLAIGDMVFQAARSGGSDTLDWDVLMLLPAGGQYAELADVTSAVVSATGHTRVLIDGVEEVAAALSAAGDPTTGGTTIKPAVARLTGGFPYLLPNQSNRIHVIPWRSSASTGASTVTTTTTVTAAYWPRYLFVRPVST